MESQVGKLVEAIQQLQARVAELELQAVPSTPQEVQDQREETARSAVERIKALALECKNLVTEVRKPMSALQKTQN
jgi:hypothetical protein